MENTAYLEKLVNAISTIESKPIVQMKQTEILELLKEARDRTNHPGLTPPFQNILDFNDKYFPNWREPDDVFLTNAIAGEVGELCNMAKHNAGGGTNQRTHGISEMGDECADIFIYMALLLLKHNVTGIEFRDLVEMKLEENIERMEKLQLKNEDTGTHYSVRPRDQGDHNE